MAATIQELFGSRELTATAKTFASDQNDHLVTDVFKGGDRQSVDDPRHVEWQETRFDRNTAPMVGLAAPSVKSEQFSRIDHQSACITIKEHVFLEAEKLFHDSAPGQIGSNPRANAAATIGVHLEKLVKRIGRTVEKACVDLAQGSLAVSAATFPGSTTKFTLTLPVTTGQYANSWATAGTKIVTAEIKRMVDAYRAAVNMAPGRVLLNSAIEAYLLANTEFQDVCKANPLWAAALLRSNNSAIDVVNGVGLGSLDWKKHLGSYSAAGAFTEFMPAKKMIVLPPPSMDKDFIGFAEASAIVPRTLWGNAAQVGIEKLPPGIAAYTEVSGDPVGIKLIVIYHFLPYLLFPEAAMLWTVAP